MVNFWDYNVWGVIFLVAAFLLTCLAITQAKLQVRKSIYILQESFFLHSPTESERWE